MSLPSSSSSSSTTATSIQDLPDAILTHILSLLTPDDTRTRNSASLVSLKWRTLERLTRSHLTLRGNIRHLLDHLPTSFSSVTHLDLSLLSPWGLPLSPTTTTTSDPASLLLAHRLGRAFPSVTTLTLYCRSSSTLSLLSPFFTRIHTVKLIRWHQRPNSTLPGSDFIPLFHNCRRLISLDLSCFYYWSEDLMPAFLAHPTIALNLVALNLLNFSLSEGFKSHELVDITGACPNLRDFRVGCVFDPRYIGFVGDDALAAISHNCKQLRVLHLADIGQGDIDEDGFCTEDAGISVEGIFSFFTGLTLIEDLVLDVWRNVRGSWVCLEALASKCPNLRSLQLGCFHGVCKAIESHLDGVALCQGLESLTIKNSADLTDLGLIEIGRGCSKLAKFEVIGCKKITMRGLRTLVCLLKSTLVEVKISGCKYLDASASLKTVEPIRERIRRLHIDCVWEGERPEDEDDIAVLGVDDIHEIEGKHDNGFDEELYRTCKRARVSWDTTERRFMMNGNMKGGSTSNGYLPQTWKRLEFLSLWIGVGELLTPLADAGLEDCPSLREVHIKVEGDCRERPKPSQAFGISSLYRYPMLSKMKLDCGDTIGYALTAPSGHMDLSLWERWFLDDIRSLSLNELDYWPPQDREVNQRSLSLPAAGLLAQCISLRKLFIHGTTHEHFMMFLLNIPNLRDVQLRGDYYPAPENDMSTEMRVDSCCRFEYKLNSRHIPD